MRLMLKASIEEASLCCLKTKKESVTTFKELREEDTDLFVHLLNPSHILDGIFSVIPMLRPAPAHLVNEGLELVSVTVKADIML